MIPSISMLSERPAVVTPSDYNRGTCHAPAGPRAIWLNMKRSPSPRREAGVGLVQIGHVAGRGGQQWRLRDRERRGGSLVLSDLRHHGLARAVEILAVVGHEFARLPQTGEIAVDLWHHVARHHVPASPGV